MQMYSLDPISMLSQSAWSSSLCGGLDVILTGRGVLGPVDWTGLAGSPKTIHQARLAFWIRHA
jgi:hypothetical protein